MFKLKNGYAVKQVDTRNWSLVKKMVTTKGDNIGSEYDDVIGYYPNLEYALKDGVRMCINTSESDNVLKTIQELCVIIEKFCQ